MSGSGCSRNAFEELRLAGEEAYAHKKLADLLYAEGFYREAGEHYAAADRFAPDEPDVKHGLAAARTLTAISEAAPTAPGTNPPVINDDSLSGRRGPSARPGGSDRLCYRRRL